MVRLFNSLARYDGSGGDGRPMELEAGSAVADILGRFGIPPGEVFLVPVNGRDITPQPNGGARLGFAVEEGDVAALSGPVPYSGAMARPAGFDPTTPRLGIWCSIRLSYGRLKRCGDVTPVTWGVNRQ